MSPTVQAARPDDAPGADAAEAVPDRAAIVHGPDAVSYRAPARRTGIHVGGERSRFVVGQDAQGHWIAVEIHGRAGGLFRSREAALGYAEDETAHRPDAVLLAAEPIALRI